MTVVVAAICQKEKAIVLAADRAAIHHTDAGPMRHNAPVSKIQLLPSGAAVACSGGSEEGLTIIRRIGGMPPELIPEWIRGQRKDCRRRFIEEQHGKISPASPFLGQLSPDPEFRYYQEQAIVMANGWGLDFLIAGVDGPDPRLWTITEYGENGRVTDCFSAGFAAIGTGGPRALWSLADWTRRRGFTEDLSLAVYAVFEAKKDAEQASDIGPETDLVILRDGGKSFCFRPDQLEPFEKAYREMRPVELQRDSHKAIKDLLGKADPPTG
jgi:hypothetical protein